MVIPKIINETWERAYYFAITHPTLQNEIEYKECIDIMESVGKILKSPRPSHIGFLPNKWKDLYDILYGKILKYEKNTLLKISNLLFNINKPTIKLHL